MKAGEKSKEALGIVWMEKRQLAEDVEEDVRGSLSWATKLWMTWQNSRQMLVSPAIEVQKTPTFEEETE